MPKFNVTIFIAAVLLTVGLKSPLFRLASFLDIGPEDLYAPLAFVFFYMLINRLYAWYKARAEGHE